MSYELTLVTKQTHRSRRSVPHGIAHNATNIF